MSQWNLAYENGFRITTEQPSVVAVALEQRLPPISHVADLACGKGRNTAFFLKKGHTVDASDIVDLQPLERISERLRLRAHFACCDAVDNRALPAESYGGVLMARFIQYLAWERLMELMCMIARRTSDGALLGVSYVESGGAVDGDVLNVERFRHQLDSVVRLLDTHNFTVISHNEGDKTKYVPHSLPAVTHEIIAQKFST